MLKLSPWTLNKFPGSQAKVVASQQNGKIRKAKPYRQI